MDHHSNRYLLPLIQIPVALLLEVGKLLVGEFSHLGRIDMLGLDQRLTILDR